MSGYIKTLFRRFFGKPLEIELVEACEAIPGLQKLGENSELEFDYLRILELSRSLRENLLPRGIVMIPNDLECLEEVFETADGRMTEARVKTEFTVTNGWKELKFCSYGSARDVNGFAVAIAQTMGLKAFLKRISLQYGENDDPELPRWAHRETDHQRKRQLDYQRRAWADGVRNSGMTKEKVEAILSEAMDQKVTSEDIVSLPCRDFDVAMQILLRNSDLTEVLEMSKRDARAKKEPQPIVSILDHQAKDEIAGD